MNLYSITITTAMSVVRSTNKTLGVDLPAALVRDLETLSRFDNTDLTPPDAPPLAALILDAWVDGRDPLDHPDVKRYALLRALGNISEPVQQELDSRRAALVRKHAPAIVKTWAAAVAAADRALSQAREAIPSLNLRDGNAVAALPAGNMGQWGAARDAVLRVEKIGQAWSMLATATGLARMDDVNRPLIVADLDLDTLNALRRPDPAEVAHEGHRLSLATFEEYTSRRDRLNAERASRDERRRRDAERRARTGEPVPNLVPNLVRVGHL